MFTLPPLRHGNAASTLIFMPCNALQLPAASLLPAHCPSLAPGHCRPSPSAGEGKRRANAAAAQPLPQPCPQSLPALSFSSGRQGKGQCCCSATALPGLGKVSSEERESRSEGHEAGLRC